MNKYLRVRDPLGDSKDGHILTRAIIDTIHEPLVVLDEELRIIAASRSFYKKFGNTHKSTRNRLFFEIDKGVWRSPALKKLLEKVIPKHQAVEEYELTHTFASLGERTMLVNAREIRYDNGRKKMLLSIFDITDQRVIEKKIQSLIETKNILLKEMSHRIANSLQLISSILLLKANAVPTSEGRHHLKDAQQRIMSVAVVQRHLDATGIDAKIEVGKYLTALCASLAKSMIGSEKKISLKVTATEGNVTSDQAISLGLFTTELVINSLKYAFPRGRCEITVTYRSKKAKWRLTIADNGVGYAKKDPKNQQGLGTTIVESLAGQLKAKLLRTSTRAGTRVSMAHV